jgi:hypothetical protein
MSLATRKASGQMPSGMDTARAALPWAVTSVVLVGAFAGIQAVSTPGQASRQSAATPRVGVDEMGTRTLQDVLSKVAQGTLYANARLG